ncbi:dTDP-4-dehydrorhamnose reductase [Idiomarina sp. MD25a]|uniref:dTDP-4-dehydrorhamnose reductase n=1 Tax=Idiomarina sp. MD25a TaxID=1889913 RepID=UPI0008F93DE3|nr:dTDP-4-dehydrorhamnose reductase [Idiomarina sp. MD25a]OIM99444.1 dTDP-4-dehydrorhamnose reductase [Idiomarina sp. MD25a]
MKIFLTGVTGQVGYELYNLLKRDYELFAPTRGELDLYDRNAVLEALADYSPDIIINAAAYTAVDKAEEEVELAFALNAHLPETLSRFAAARGIRLFHYSTDYVYSGEGSSARGEDAQTGPLSVYGNSKLAGDQAVLRNTADAIIFRTSWVYSYRGKNFMNTMLKLAQEKQQLSIVDDQIGAPTPASVIAEVTVKALKSPQMEGGVYHLVTRGSASWFEFAEAIFDIAKTAGHSLKVTKVNSIQTSEYPTPASRPLNSRLKVDKLESVLNIELPTWQNALVQTYERREN